MMHHGIEAIREIVDQTTGGHMATNFAIAIAATMVSLCLIVTPASAQDKILTDPKAAKDEISGKDWIAQAVKAPLGGTSCEQGRRYRFRSNGTAKFDNCVDGTWVIQEISWSISGGGIYMLNMVLDEIAYEATLVKRSDKLELVLENPATYKDVNVSRINMTYDFD